LPLEQKLEEVWKDYWVEENPEILKKVTKVAKLFGNFGVPLAAMGAYPYPDEPQKVVRDKVRKMLIEIAKVPELDVEASGGHRGPGQNPLAKSLPSPVEGPVKRGEHFDWTTNPA
jgi:hypothetical protein